MADSIKFTPIFDVAAESRDLIEQIMHPNETSKEFHEPKNLDFHESVREFNEPKNVYENIKDFEKNIDFNDSVKEFHDYDWPSSVRVTLVRQEEELGMYLEEKEGRKRKWQENYGKTSRSKMEEAKEERRGPPKKFIGVTEMGNGGASSSSSHLSPGWQVNDIDIDLAGELSMNEALLSLPSLTVFKQEAPSPTGAAAGAAQLSPPRRWLSRRPLQDDRQMTESMAVEGAERDGVDEGMRQQSPNNNAINTHGLQEQMQCQQPMQSLMSHTGYTSAQTSPDNRGTGLLMCSPTGSLDGFLQSPLPPRQNEQAFRDDQRFQYVLAAATSIATKTNEETLTYLNQGQPYEIKLKKLGDLSLYKGKILKSIVKICFHERRLQYMEREQMALWHSERPGERIVEIDIPLSYGVIRVSQPSAPHQINSVEVLWDPTKDVGVYIKVNCISTEFTAKKHGGEKGVPFRVQVETYLVDQEQRLHAAACQIKVFKLKGADRKHKQDREKVMRRPRSDLDKFQPSCDSTVLTTLTNDALLPPPSLISNSPPYSPEMCVSTPKPTSNHVSPKPSLTGLTAQTGILAPTNQIKQLYCQEGADIKVSSPPCHSPGSILPDLPQQGNNTDEADKNGGLSKEATASETHSWLSEQRFSQHTATFTNFSGADLLRLSRDDLIQICGLADGIRLFNALHAKRIEPRLTVYVCAGASTVYNAIYLHSCKATELMNKIKKLLGKECDTLLVSGPNGARVRLTDELVRHMPDNSTYKLEHSDNVTLMTPTNH